MVDVDIVQHLATFICIVESRSISGAARRLRLSVPMASRHLRALEEELGVPLLRRTTRRLDLTEAGAELLPRARHLLAELQETREAMRPGEQAGGLLTLSVPVSFGLSKVAPLLPRLLDRHPRLSIDVRFEDRFVDLIGDGVDLALRVGGSLPDSPFILGRRLATYERVLCAAPSFVSRHGALTEVEQLASVPCMVLGSTSVRWQFETSTGAKSVVVGGRVRSNNILALRGAALSGLGVVQMPTWLVAQDLRSGRLVRVLARAALSTVSVMGLMHVDARGSNGLRLVQDFLARELPRALRTAPARRA